MSNNEIPKQEHDPKLDLVMPLFIFDDKEALKVQSEGYTNDFDARELELFNTSVEKAKLISEEISLNFPKIIEEVQSRIKKIIPEFEFKECQILFGFYGRSNFRAGKNSVYVDLIRLTKDVNYMETLIEGISHEMFHVWFFDGYDHVAEHAERVDLDTHRNYVLLRTLDEGIAVFVSGQSLRDFYKKRDMDYDTANRIGRGYVATVLDSQDKDEIEKIYLNGFSNMGPMYVVGREIVEGIISEGGVEKLRQIILELKQSRNPKKYFSI